MYESGENYLETILMLKEKNGTVRSIDIARELEFSKPSVSRAVGILKENGYITVENGGELELTAQGSDLAKSIYERHKLLTEFLMKVADVSEEIAEKDACKMEHIVSKEVFQGIKAYLSKSGV